MKKLQTQLKELQSTHSLSKREKNAMRDVLTEYTKLNPIRNKNNTVTNTPLFKIFKQHKLVSFTLVVTLFFSSGAVYASTDALPGDKLYKVKEVVEDIHEQIVFSDSAKAILAEKLMERRESELLRLEAMGKLDDEKLKIIDTRMQRHKMRADKVIKHLNKSKPQQAIKIKKEINKRTIKMENMQLERLSKIFDMHLMEIQREYGDAEQTLKDLENEIEYLNTAIPN